jgi:hypothetical protein
MGEFLARMRMLSIVYVITCLNLVHIFLQSYRNTRVSIHAKIRARPIITNLLAVGVARLFELKPMKWW